MINSNPYYNIAGIKVSGLFFNRENVIQEMLNQLFSDAPACLAIVGQRKIGKTSLLMHLSRPEIIQNYEYLPDNHIFVYFDCQLHQNKLDSADEFLSEMLKELMEIDSPQTKFLHKESFEPSKKIIDTWINILKIFVKNNKFLVFIFDEFERAIARESLHQDNLFGNLRALHRLNFIYVTSTYIPLGDLFQSAYKEFNIQQIHMSQFYNIVSTHVLDAFDDESIKALITGPSTASGVNFSEDEIRDIIDFGGNFPFFIQRACYYHFNNHNGKTNQLNTESIRRQLLRDSVPIWGDFWSVLSEKQRKIMSAIANNRETKASDDEIAGIDPALIYKGIDGRWHLFSKEFSLFVQNQSQPIEQFVKVGEWIDGSRYKIIEIVSNNPRNPTQVVKAFDERWENTRAIKLIRTEQDMLDSELIQPKQILRREAKILVQLYHPNIGRVFDILVENPIGIVMEWVEGEPLSKRIQREKDKKIKKLPLVSIIRIAIQLSDALVYLHQHQDKIVHRDIKPENIILLPNNSPKLIDFGIARNIALGTISSREDGSHFFVGTPHYSSPEQFKLLDTGPATDIFSLGVVLYELLTHKMPFPYYYGDVTFYNDHKLPIPDPAGLPKEIYQILCGLLSQDPYRRPTASALKIELENYLQKLSTDSN